jgi:hypothetical protein
VLRSDSRTNLSRALPADVGADAAKQEIIAEMEHLQLCEACRQRLYEQRKLRAEDAGPGKKSLTSLQRINKILGLMEMYPKKAHVQMSGVEAIADFAAHGKPVHFRPYRRSMLMITAGKTVALHNTSLPQHLAAVLENFSHSSDMVWRVCRAITNICAQGDCGVLLHFLLSRMRFRATSTCIRSCTRS